MKRTPALVYYTQLYMAGHEPSLEDFILKGYSRATYFRAKRDFKEYYGKQFYSLEEVKECDVK